ncbi:MAG: alpha/beta hydrolase [Myxococcales bacterium]|nr:alpha/beta hydrolase [Myxococcales bacterium]
MSTSALMSHAGPPPDAARPSVESFATAEDGTRLYVRWRRLERDSFARPSSDPVAAVEAPTALLCDGLVCDGFIYKYLWDDLATRMAVAHFNYRGHGRSEAPRDRERIDVAALAGDVHAVRAHLGEPPVVLVGHSLGTQVALEAYRARPDAVRALVLVCGSFGRVTHTFKGSDILASVLPGLMDFAVKHPKLVRAVWGRMPIKTAVRLAQLVGDIDRRVRPEDVEPYFRHVADFDFELFLRMLSHAGEHSAQDLLKNVQVPALVIGAENDTFTPPALSEAMAESLPRGELFMVPGATHVAPLEHPQLIAERIIEFLEDHRLLG